MLRAILPSRTLHTAAATISTSAAMPRRRAYLPLHRSISGGGCKRRTSSTFSADIARPVSPPPGTYTGSVNSIPTEPGRPSNPSVPWTGTTGTVSLTVAGGTITGSAPLSPVNPQTRVPVAGPPVNASYVASMFVASSGSS
jgi:hypothetical protein